MAVSIYRSEKWQLSYACETNYGEAPDGALTRKHIFGALDNATLPDPEFDHQPIWGMSGSSNRNYYMAYRGRARLNGSIPDVILLNGFPLALPLCDNIVHGTGAAPYTHTINETNSLKSIGMVATYYDATSSNVATLNRWYTGGKVNRATYKCDEGGMLQMSLDDIIFQNVFYDGLNMAAGAIDQIAPWFDTDTADQSLSYPTTQPYYFSRGSFKLKLAATGTPLDELSIANLRRFQIEVNNNLEPKYYLATSGNTTANVPYNIYEGKREIRLSMLMDLVDTTGEFDKNYLFLELLNQGVAANVIKGNQFDITFTRANASGTDESIQFVTPPSTPTSGGDAQGNLIIRAPHGINSGESGVVTVGVEMLCRSMKIVTIDSVGGAAEADSVDTAGAKYPML